MGRLDARTLLLGLWAGLAPMVTRAAPPARLPAPNADEPRSVAPATWARAGSDSLPVAALPMQPHDPRPVPAVSTEPAETPDERSKKALLLDDKIQRQPVRRIDVPPLLASAVLTLTNQWTHELLPLRLPSAPLTAGRSAPPLPGARPRSSTAVRVPLAQPSHEEVERFDTLLRCHYTNQATGMDPRLLDVVLRAASHFRSTTVQLVSGFRAPKYQKFLQKKGHEVARDSEHTRGHAVDFRLPGVPTRQLLAFVKSLHVGGVGFYPESRFVHADVGRVRFWRGH